MTKTAQADNRWSPRQQVTLDITLHVPGQFPFSGVARNVSLGGLFVETDTTRLVDGIEVYLGVTIHTKTGTNHYRVPARSNRQNRNGVALVFTMSDSEISHGLRQLLYPAPALAPAPAFTHATILRPTG